MSGAFSKPMPWAGGGSTKPPMANNYLDRYNVQIYITMVTNVSILVMVSTLALVMLVMSAFLQQ